MLTKENQSAGGTISSQKIYHCNNCNGLGRNQRFVDHHLSNECDGKQKRKVKACTEENQHRLQEAMVNSKEWKANEAMKQANLLFKGFKQETVKHIEELHAINQEVMEEMIIQYYTRLF